MKTIQVKAVKRENYGKKAAKVFLPVTARIRIADWSV